MHMAGQDEVQGSKSSREGPVVGVSEHDGGRPDADPQIDAELEAVIREARRRTRRRRTGIAVALASLAALIAAIGSGSSGDGPSPEPGPGREEIQAAAQRLVAAPTGLEVTSSSETTYTYAGTADFSRGEYDMRFESGNPRERALQPKRAMSVREYGQLSGYAVNSTFPLVAVGDKGDRIGLKRDVGPRPSLDRCWFDPHSPVGAGMGAISIEESLGLTGSITDRLATGGFTIVGSGPGTVDVTMPTAVRGPIKQDPERVTNPAMMRLLDGPVTLKFEGGSLAGIDATLFGYQPYQSYLGSAFTSAANRRLLEKYGLPDRSMMSASFAPTGIDRLEFNQPSCIAME